VKPSLAQRSVAECLGTAFLLAAVIGSGIMAARLSNGNGALVWFVLLMLVGLPLCVRIPG
jgi:glycerol uptake facilitator-like aquaporin